MVPWLGGHLKKDEMQVKAGSSSFITEMDKIMKIVVYFCSRELDYGNGLK